MNRTEKEKTVTNLQPVLKQIKSIEKDDPPSQNTKKIIKIKSKDKLLN